MAYQDNKYHIKINGKGYTISQNRNGVRYYQKKRAPTFVSKFGSGDSSYRDGTYWQYFAQSNWRNGSKQLKFDDPGRFWKSSDVNPTDSDKLTLSKKLVSAGQLASGIDVNVIESWRNSASNQAAFDASSTTGSGTSPLSWSHTCTGNNRLLVVSVTQNVTTDKITGITYGGVALTKLDGNVNVAAIGTDSFWYLLNPASGTNTITVTATGSDSIFAAAASYTGILALDAHTSSNSGSSATTWAQAITSTVDNCWAIGFMNASASYSSAGANTTHRIGNGYGGSLADSNMSITPAGSFSLNWNTGNGTHSSCIATFSPVISTVSSSEVAYAGGSDGKIYSWDNATTWTEVFDTRQLTWYETGNDTDKIVGDTGGTETAQAQSFQIAASTKVKGIAVYLKKNAGTPGNITVRIETNNAGVPSGTLASADATGTISSFSTTSYGWKTLDFTNNFSLSASTTYWLVLKTAAAANDNNYALASDASSPSYASGNMASSTDGGSTWSAVAGTDAYFRIKGNTTQVNCCAVSALSGTKKMYWGIGDISSSENGDARIVSFDGTTWALNKTLTTAACVLSIKESAVQNKVFLGTGPNAIVYSTADFTTYTSSDDINTPSNPGYPYAMLEYNSSFYVGGGSPEVIPTQYYNGFLRFNNTVDWDSLYPFDFTVLKSLEFYDSFMFIGTYHGQVYLYDTSSLSPLFNFKEQYNYQVQVKSLKYFDDKLYIALRPQEGTGETNTGIWMFDRRGLHLAHTVSGVTKYNCFAVVNGSLLVGTGADGYVYKLSTSDYPTTGYYQASYYDANLPSIPKLYKEVVIRHDPLVSGQSITVWYKFKESDSWTQLTTGVDNSVGSEEQTLSFASGVTSKKISLKVVLNGGGTDTPTLTEVVMQYSLYPEFKWQWNMRLKAKKNLKLADDTTDSRSASTIRSELEALMETETLYTFIDIDGTSYSVLVNDIDQTTWVINPDDVSEDEIVLNLLEA